MADIKIKIDIQSGEHDVINTVNYNKNTNNVSRPTSYKTAENNGKNLKSWATGSLSLADGYVGGSDSFLGEQGKYNGFMFGAVSPDGQYTLTLTIDGSNIDSITVFGDRNANQFPTRAYLDGDNSNYIFSDDPQWTIIFPNKASSHTITFDLWNRPDYNACLTHIAIFANELYFDSKWLKNMESTSQSTDDPNGLFYGVLPNSATIDILDRNGEIYDYVNDGIITNSSLPVSIYFNGKKVQHHIVQDSEYDINQSILTLSLQNIFLDWEDIRYNGYSYPKKQETAYNILLSVFKSVGYEDESVIRKMLSNKIIFGNKNEIDTVENYLRRIIIPYPYLEADTLKNTIDKFCRLAQLQVLKNDRNETVFVSARPLFIGEYNANIIQIPKNKVFGNISKSIILKNKYKAVELNAKKINDITDFDNLITKYSVDVNSANYTDSVYSTPDGYHIYKIETFYSDGKFNLDKIQNNGLLELLKLNIDSNPDNDGYYNLSKRDGDLTVSTTYKMSSGYFINENQALYDVDKGIFAQTPYYSNIKINKTLEEIFTGKIPTEHQAVWDGYKISIKDESYVKVKDMGDYFSVIYHVLSESIIYELWVKYIANDVWGGTIIDSFALDNIRINKANSIDISIYGVKREISFEDISVSDSNVNQVDTFASISNSELLEENTMFDNVKMTDIIKNNIKNDYINGISTCSVDLACGDYLDEDGNRVKIWNKGDILETGEYIKLYNDDRIWKITNRTIKKQGVPIISLKAQEAKIGNWVDLEQLYFTVNYPKNTLGGIFEDTYIKYTDYNIVRDGTKVAGGTILKYTGHGYIKNLYINGKEILRDETFVVTKDIYITANYEWEETEILTLDFKDQTVVWNPNNYQVLRDDDGDIVVVGVKDSSGFMSNATSRFDDLNPIIINLGYGNEAVDQVGRFGSGDVYFDIEINEKTCEIYNARTNDDSLKIQIRFLRLISGFLS